MRFLHTADWHVGKTLKGAQPARRAGAGAPRDRRASPASTRSTPCSSPATSTTPRRPSPQAQQLVVRTLLGLAARPAPRSSRSPATTTTRPTLDAYRPLAGAAGHHAGRHGAHGRAAAASSSSPPGRPASGRRVAVLPFLSQRYAVRAAELVAQHPGGEHRRLRPAAARHPGARSPRASATTR